MKPTTKGVQPALLHIYEAPKKYLRGAQKIYVNGLNLETRQEMAYVSFGQIESGLRKG